MLSIDGQTYAEVFANLSIHPDLDAVEQQVAKKIADYFVEHTEIERAVAAKRGMPGYDPIRDDTDAEAEAEHAKLAPFWKGPTSDTPFSFHGSESRTFIAGSIRFMVWPFTTGPTMNVCVERAPKNAFAQ